MGGFLLQETRFLLQRLREDRSLRLVDLLAYRIDFWFSRSKFAKPLALVAATGLLILVGAFALHSVSHQDFPSALWTSWVYVADPGAHSEQRGVAPRTVSLFLTVGGMLIFALVVGVVADGTLCGRGLLVGLL